MLIAFEGQDGAGKTTLLAAVQRELERRGVRVSAVAEFSDSSIGLRLLDALTRDKFLRAVEGDDATAITRALDVIADMYYVDEHQIGPASERGDVVLKDRHYASILTTLAPTLVEAGAVEGEPRALAWLTTLLGELRYPPDITVVVEAPLDVRLERIRSRSRHLAEHRAADVSDNDLEVFAHRERLMRLLIAAEPSRFMTIDNGHVPLEEGVHTVVSFVMATLKNHW